MRHLRSLTLIFTISTALRTYGAGYVVWPDEPFIIPVLPRATNATNAPPLNPGSPADVLTQRNNNQRTGTTLSSSLGQASVVSGRFGYVATLKVDGAILAQPLYMASVKVGGARRSAVFIATAKNKVFAFSAAPPFDPLWRAPADLGSPDIDAGACGANLMAHSSGDSNTFMNGIESTPVIDAASGRMFVSYRHWDGNKVRQRIAALNVADGSIVRDPTSGELLDKDVESDDAWNRRHRNRASLLLVDRVVFVAFAALCEDPDPGNVLTHDVHGRVMAFDAKTLERIGDYRVTLPPDDDGGGIWQGSTGIASDSKGNLFFATGNQMNWRDVASADPEGRNLSSSIVRLAVTRLPIPFLGTPRALMLPADWFTPYRKTWQDRADMDLGAGGVVVIPGTPYLVAGGKEGIIYLVNQTRMGKFDVSEKFKSSGVIDMSRADAPDDPLRDHMHQKFVVAHNQYLPDSHVPMNDWMKWAHIHGTPVFGVFGEGNAFLYVWPEKDHLQSYRWLGDRFETQAILATGLQPDIVDGVRHPKPALLAPPLTTIMGAVGMPGGMLSLAVNPVKPGTGVLFASVQRCRKWVGPDSDPAEPFQECSVDRCNTPAKAALEKELTSLIAAQSPPWKIAPIEVALAAAEAVCGEQRFGMLRAFDPLTLAELWNDQLDGQAAPDVRNYWYAKFIPPTIANNRVFLATWSDRVLVYGTLGQ